MLKELNSDEASEQSQWLSAFWTGETRQLASGEEPSCFEHVGLPSDFRRRFLSLLSYQFSSFHPTLALTILQNKKAKETHSKTFPPSLLEGFMRTKPISARLWPSQLSVARNWRHISALTTWNGWSCTPGVWWTITSSWTWSQWWHASFSSSSSVTCLSLLPSVWVAFYLLGMSVFSSVRKCVNVP